MNNNAIAETRGWEIERDYHQHWADDVTYDLAEDASEGSTIPAVALAVLLLVIIVGVYLLGKWLEPIAVTFPIPIVNIQPPVPSQGTLVGGAFVTMPGWRYQYLYVDVKTKTVSGNCRINDDGTVPERDRP